MIYRAFGRPGRFAEGVRLARVCRARGIVLLVAGDLELARRIKADGVHWPERMLSRRRFGWVATAAAHSRMAVMRARSAGVDAVILSAVFDSRSPSAGRPMGPMRFRLTAKGARLPVYALGGVNAWNARRLAGAAGFAAVEVIAGAFGS